MYFAIALIFGFIFGIFSFIDHRSQAKKSGSADYLFNTVFAILIAILGYLLAHNDGNNKILCAALLFGIGWFFSFFCIPTRLITNKIVRVPIQIIVLVLLSAFVFTRQNNTDVPRKYRYEPDNTSHSCCICGEKASNLYGGDYWCTRHYYMAKTSEGDLSP